MKKWCIAIAASGLLTICTGIGAQTDSAVTALSNVAPGLAYSPEKMAVRLMEIAEGSVPTRQDIEREFGFKFQVGGSDRCGVWYLASGKSPPFAQPEGIIPRNVMFTDASSCSHISVSFQFERTDWQKPYSKFCIKPVALERELTERWKARDRKSGGHQPTHFFWTRTIASIERHLEVSPEERGRSGSCLNSFYVRFEISPTTTNLGESK